MSAFPENDLAILEDYRADVPANLGTMRQALARCSVAEERKKIGKVTTLTAIRSPAGARRVNGARRVLLGFLAMAVPAVAALQQQLDEQAYRPMRRREFTVALGKIEELAFPSGRWDVSAETIQTAFDRTDIPDVTVVTTTWMEPSGHEPEPEPVEVEDTITLKGYGGPAPSPAQVAALLRIAGLFGGAERAFRQGLLRSECRIGEGELDAAVDLYDRLLALPGLPAAQRKLAAIRCSAAHLARGDALFRATRDPDAGQRSRIAAEYDRAVAVLDREQVAAANPVCAQLRDRVVARKARVQNGFNALGYRDSYVPAQRTAYCLKQAQDYVQLACQLAAQYLSFLDKAEQATVADADWAFQQQQARDAAAIAQDHVDNAADTARAMADKVEMLEHEEGWLWATAVLDVRDLLAQTVSAAATGGMSAAGSVGAAQSMVVDFLARYDGLQHQQAMAAIERDIAERDRDVARLEKQMADRRAAFVDEMARFATTRALSADQYYGLASACADLLVDNLEAGILWAYLYERAVAFRRLDDPHLVRLDYASYLAPPAPGLRYAARLAAAPSVLTSTLVELQARDTWNVTHQELSTNWISLRNRYPIEFAGLLQQRRMDFAISLYDLERLEQGGGYHQRIKSVGIRLVGLSPATHYGGWLDHSGVFLLRDRDSTLDPATGRLVPTEAEMAEALRQAGQGAAQGTVRVRGVMPFALPLQRFEFTENTLRSGVGGMENTTLDVFELYGAASLWHLEFNDDVDLRFLDDVELMFTFDMPMADPALGQKVRTLARLYEAELAGGDALDLIGPVSLSGQFPAAFYELSSGAATFTLEARHFPSQLSNLRFKAVVGQALDQERRPLVGIGLEISRPGTSFVLRRTTLASGMTEDQSTGITELPPDERFDLLGTWRVALSDPSQHALLGDCRLFFVYTYTRA